ncbi:MAG: hypothetical protein ACK5XF_09660 [Neisseriaceae bacterium]
MELAKFSANTPITNPKNSANVINKEDLCNRGLFSADTQEYQSNYIAHFTTKMRNQVNASKELDKFLHSLKFTKLCCSFYMLISINYTSAKYKKHVVEKFKALAYVKFCKFSNLNNTKNIDKIAINNLFDGIYNNLMCNNVVYDHCIIIQGDH